MTQLSNIMHKEHDGFLYVYFENYDDDCNCMWRKILSMKTSILSSV